MARCRLLDPLLHQLHGLLMKAGSKAVITRVSAAHNGSVNTIADSGAERVIDVSVGIIPVLLSERLRLLLVNRHTRECRNR